MSPADVVTAPNVRLNARLDKLFIASTRERGCAGLLRPLGPRAHDQAEQASGPLKAIAHPVRLRLMSMVRGACVCDLTPAFDPSQPTISHHLRVAAFGVQDPPFAAVGLESPTVVQSVMTGGAVRAFTVHVAQMWHTIGQRNAD